VFSRTESKAVVGLIVLDKFIPSSIVTRMNIINQSADEYKQFQMLKSPLKITHLIMLAIVSLLTIFASIWFGFFLSKSITIPIQELAEGTKRIAGGDYDFSIDIESSDEIGVLVDSFNKMTQDLKTGKKQLDEANKELLHSNVELDQRRLYMEIVLANVAAGVISADAEGRVLTINKSAEKMLNIKAADMIGKDYRQVLRSEHLKIVEQLFEDKSFFQKGFAESQVKITIANKTLSLLVTIAILRDDHAKYLGLVAVLEDLTEIERAQRMAAWREVARRIAHEVKNPLTPIQLSAQRLQKKYRDKIAPTDIKIFDECTKLIIDQVEELKLLVNEFSRYARLPTAVPSPNNLKQILNEVVSLYKQGARNVRFSIRDSVEIPIFKFDREEMKRALINLIDNAMDAIDAEGEIEITLSHDPAAEIVRIEIADNGKGIPAEHINHIFEPYFSTKKHGTGLGLDIVNTIISEHAGNIRVEENKPKGTRFIIDLPVIL
ncbi:MAG: HAMP domain-containing protein, partial [Desulfobacteraceae bacterium]